MAYKTTLTPILGEDVEETTAEFMNMKFAELLGNTEDNRNQISILNDVKSASGISTDVLQLPKGKWFAAGLTNAPTTGWYIYNITYLADGYRHIRANGYSDNRGKEYFGMIEANVFQGWKNLATSDKIDISFFGGWANPSEAKCTKIGSRVFWKCSISQGTRNAGTVIANLPPGFRPSTTKYFIGDETSDNITVLRTFYSVGTNGDVVLSAATTKTFMYIDIAFEI